MFDKQYHSFAKAGMKHAAALFQLQVAERFEALQNNEKYTDQRCLVRHGYKQYSQCDEDGILAEIFRRIGAGRRTFVEFGVGNGLENNTLSLLMLGWTGLWIDAHAGDLRTSLGEEMHSSKIAIVETFITKDNIDVTIRKNLDTAQELDLLVVDIDGNDWHVFNAINCVMPRVVVVEYNAKFRPPNMFCMDYEKSHEWNNDDYFGASLKFLETAMRTKGYELVGCGLAGINAFFVRKDLCGDHFLAPFTAEKHYEPARYYLCDMEAGHKTSIKSLKTVLKLR